MKKIFAVLMALTIVFALAACGKAPSEPVTSTPSPTPQEESTVNPDGTLLPDTEGAGNVTKPAESAKPEKTPAAEKTEAPVATAAPTEAPAAPKTVGNILLEEFRANAANKDALGLAEMLVANPVIQFMGGAMPVEPGFLTGFGNTEITGFTSGAMFAPMIGTIPFVGYVFELASAGEAAAFLAKLNAAADLRWNICTSADEKVSGSVGNKVFFVMSPISFDEA